MGFFEISEARISMRIERFLRYTARCHALGDANSGTQAFQTPTHVTYPHYNPNQILTVHNLIQGSTL
jgi:hypothetical protein